MAQGKFISYLRVSTDKQGRSGLGLEAQRQAVNQYLNGGDWQLIKEYVEVESGKRSDRPKLREALEHAEVIGATLVFAKIDRLTRNTKLLLELIESGAEVVFCDLPNLPAGPSGKFILTQMAAVAELEAGLISQRTKAALAEAKRRGVKLGNPRGAEPLQGIGNDAAVAVVKANADQRAAKTLRQVEAIRAEGVTSVRGIAEELNRRHIRTPRGGQWHATSVQRLLHRLNA